MNQHWSRHTLIIIFFKPYFQVHSIVTKLTDAVMTSENYCTTTLWTIFDKQILSKRLIGGKKKGVLISSLHTYPGGRQGGYVMSLSSIVGTFLLFPFRLMGIKVPGLSDGCKLITGAALLVYHYCPTSL